MKQSQEIFQLDDDNDINTSDPEILNQNEELLNQPENLNTPVFKKNLMITKKKNLANSLLNTGNIGNNLVLCKKFVLGNKKNFYLFFITFLGTLLTWASWILTNNFFYSLKIYIIGTVPFIFSEIFFILCFIIEPGIIPRQCPEFIKKNDNELNDIDISNNEEITPRIFTERKCGTCGIIRPSCASHCKYCDNCVLNFDHHCFYISNCVGKRNHKFFYLFLFFGVISSFYLIICDFITIIHVFILRSNEMWKLLYREEIYILIIICALILISFLYLLLGSMNLLILFTPLGIGFILFSFLFYKHIYKRENPYFENPFVILVFFAGLSFGVFATKTFFSQTKNIASGYTIKQNMSIQKELLSVTTLHKKKKIGNKYIRKRNCGEKIKNICKFLCAKRGESLIIPKRDLY